MGWGVAWTQFRRANGGLSVRNIRRQGDCGFRRRLGYTVLAQPSFVERQERWALGEVAATFNMRHPERNAELCGAFWWRGTVGRTPGALRSSAKGPISHPPAFPQSLSCETRGRPGMIVLLVKSCLEQEDGPFGSVAVAYTQQPSSDRFHTVACRTLAWGLA